VQCGETTGAADLAAVNALWSFTEDIPGTSGHQELVPVAPLTASPADTSRLRWPSAAACGARRWTALYDTTPAAVRAVRVGWDPTWVNAFVLPTDGEDTDDHGMKLDQLLTTLRDAQSAGQPVSTIAYENDGGAEALAAISAATGGASYRTSDPAGSATCSPMRWGHAAAGRGAGAPPAADWFSASHHSDTTTQAPRSLAGGWRDTEGTT
jgi:hypothetical protein